jgi:hypothetical protein
LKPCSEALGSPFTQASFAPEACQRFATKKVKKGKIAMKLPSLALLLISSWLAHSQAATYYVSNSGSDSNAGTSSSSPWKTIAKVNSASEASGSSVLFLDTGTWHEQLTAKAGVTYGSYGGSSSCTLTTALVATCTGMPVIDGADVVTGWSVYSGSTYKAPYAYTATKGFVDAVYQQTTPLTLETSTRAVESTAGSFYSSRGYIYVHLANGANPSSHTIEICGSRKYGISIGNVSNVTINGLEIIRSAKAGIDVNNTTADNITVENNVIFNYGDTLGDLSTGLGNGGEGAIFVFPTYEAVVTGWLIKNNLVGRSDFSNSVFNYNQAGIQLYASSSATISGNNIASVHGVGLQVTDGYGSTCSSPLIQNNVFANSQGNIFIVGCSAASIVSNTISNSYGNGIEIGGGFQTSDQNNNEPYIAYNVIHNMGTAYSDGLYNGIDINHATNGTAVGNNIYAVLQACMTLESDTAASSGWAVNNNTFNASQNLSYAGTTPALTTVATPFYITNISLAGGITMSNNTLVMNSLTPWLLWGATSPQDTTHDMTLAAFEAKYPTFGTL